MGEVLGRALLTMVPADLAGNIGRDRRIFSGEQRIRDIAGHAGIGQQCTPAVRVHLPDENPSGAKRQAPSKGTQVSLGAR